MSSEDQLIKLYSDILKGDEDAIQFLLGLADPRRVFNEKVRSDFAGEIWERFTDPSGFKARSATQLQELVTEARYSLRSLRKNEYEQQATGVIPLVAVNEGVLAELSEQSYEAPPSQVMLRELLDVVRRIVNSLPETQQFTWRCYYEHRMPVREIARVGRAREAHLTLEMVKSRLKRARKFVQSRLRSHGISRNG